ncbi:hypothetical protein EDB85DRAFT_2027569, partial [Lactarius pseudohatsudake]
MEPEHIASASGCPIVLELHLVHDINSQAVRHRLKLSHPVFHSYFIFNSSMVRVTRNSKTSARVAGCAASHNTTRPRSSSIVPRTTRGPIARSAIEREKAKANARQSKKSVEVKVRLRSCTSKYGTIFIPASELLVCCRNCCLAFFPASPRSADATPRVSACNLHKHQLFSNEHADNLDAEIRQWLPRLVCPAFPLSPKGQRSDSMLRHLEYKILKMTFGQLEFLSVKLGKECRGKKRTFVKMSADKVRMVLQSWRPLSKRGTGVIYFYASGVDRATTEDEHGKSSGYDADFDTGSSSSSNTPSPLRTPLAIPDEETRQDAPTPPTLSLPTRTLTPTPEPLYPEIYLPPHLLPSTCDASEYDLAFFSHEGGANDHTREFHHIFHSYNRLSPASDVLTACYQS